MLQYEASAIGNYSRETWLEAEDVGSVEYGPKLVVWRLIRVYSPDDDEIATLGLDVDDDVDDVALKIIATFEDGGWDAIQLLEELWSEDYCFKWSTYLS